MKLLFTFDENGNDEIKELLGFTHSDFKIATIKSDIIAATDELIELIGLPIYDSAVGIFEAESASLVDTEMLFRIKLPIAINAYRNFAPDNDIAHTNNGRVALVEANQKLPWEWQIDRSNKSMEKKYYKALDAMLEFLDKNVSGWKATDAYKSTHRFIVRKTSDFDNYFSIDRSRLLFLKLSPGIRLAENNHIIPRIGRSKYTELKNLLVSGSDLNEADAALLEKIKEASVYKALSWGMRRLSVQLFPEGVTQYVASDRMSTQARLPPVKSEAEGAAQNFDIDAERAIADLENMIEQAKQIPIQDIPPLKPDFDCRDNFIST